MADGSFMAFFEDPDTPFEFKHQRDFDLHVALKVDMEHLLDMYAKGKTAGRHVRGPVDHGFIYSIYFRDPNGYVVELSAPIGMNDPKAKEETKIKGRSTLASWSSRKKKDG